MDCSTPGFPVLHHLPEFAQTCPLSWFLSLTQSHVSLEFRLSCFDLHWSACSFTQQMLPGPHCVPGTVWPHTDGGKDADTGQRLAVRAQLLAQAQPVGRGRQKAVRRRRRVSTPGPGASTVSGSGAPSPVGVAPSCLLPGSTCVPCLSWPPVDPSAGELRGCTGGQLFEAWSQCCRVRGTPSEGVYDSPHWLCHWRP